MQEVIFKEGQYVTLTQEYYDKSSKDSTLLLKGDSVLVLAVRDNVLLVRFLGKSFIVPKKYCQ